MKRSAITALAILFLALPATAGRIQIEAENYASCNDVGDDVIRKVELLGCSGGYVLEGLDYADEWTEYTLPVSEFGKFTVFVFSRGDLSVQFRFRLVLTGSASGSTQFVELGFTGLGHY